MLNNALPWLVKLIEGLEKRMKKLLLLVTLIAFASVPYIVEAKGHHKAVAQTQPQTSDCDDFYQGQEFYVDRLLGSDKLTVLNVNKDRELVAVKSGLTGSTHQRSCSEWKSMMH